MKVFANVGGMQFELEAKGDTELFEQLSHLNEVFAEKCCGHCGKEDISYQVRHVEKDKKEYDYYEMRRNSCFARLSYGQNLKGDTLFPKRKDADGKYDREHRGWVKFVREGSPATKAAPATTAKKGKSKDGDDEGTPF